MAQPFLRGCRQLLIRTCHRRGVHAMGGMAAQIPIKNDPEANLAALEKVRADKWLEASHGHDGTWVAHPGLVPLARDVFDTLVQAPNQIHQKRRAVVVVAEDLLRPPLGTRTEGGLRHNVRVGVQYLEAWLRGTGCVPLYHLMEDAATAEISRTQVWQWIHHDARNGCEDGPLGWDRADLFARGRDAAARLGARRAHGGADGGAAPVAAPAHGGLRGGPGSGHRQPGRAAGPRRSRRDLLQRVA